MKYIQYISLLCLALTLSCQSGTKPDVPEGFDPIFNGKNLEGWHISRTTHQGTTPSFTVQDGVIVGRHEPYGQGGLLLTDKNYQSFELYLEVKLDSFCNSGIFLRSNEGGAAYQVELAVPGNTGSLLGMLQLEYSYRSKQDLSLITHPEIEKAIFQEPAVSLVNLRYSISDVDDEWRIMAYIDNAFDETYRLEARSDGLFGVRERYAIGRTGGIKFSYSW